MSSILRKFKHKEAGETTFMKINGKTILKELIASSNGKYNPYRIFSAKELELATNNYDMEKVIKQGGTYKLYQGFWQDRLISVMMFENSKHRAYKCCINNIVYASQMIHKYVLQLIGCCLETEIPILVFESVYYGTLADRIYGNIQFEPLLLTQRLKIAMDIANAIAYLHLGFRRPIVFRDFKTSSILLNEENIAKLFDFSLSVSIPEGETHVTDAVNGIFNAYIAPEHLRTGFFNEKIDVYSFGVFLSELLTGQKAFDIDRWRNGGEPILQDHVKKYFEENKFNEIIDPLILADTSFPGKEQQLQAFVQLILKCVDVSPEDRPTIVDVAKQLRQMYQSSKGQVQSSSVFSFFIAEFFTSRYVHPDYARTCYLNAKFDISSFGALLFYINRLTIVNWAKQLRQMNLSVV